MEEKVQATGIIDSVEALEARMAEMRKAQAIFATYSQEQVDKIFKAAATAADKARIPLAKMAAEETGMGLVEDKVIKNHYAAEYIYNGKTRSTASRKSPNRSVSSRPSSRPLIRHQQQSSRPLSA